MKSFHLVSLINQVGRFMITNGIVSKYFINMPFFVQRYSYPVNQGPELLHQNGGGNVISGIFTYKSTTTTAIKN